MRRWTGLVGVALLATGCVAASSTATRQNPSERIFDFDLDRQCAVTKKLIPTCGAWWGVAPEAFTRRRPAASLAGVEERMGRRADIVHVYHRGGELFPTREERAIAAAPRLLLINWKPSIRHTWRQVADGAIDKRIHRLARHIATTFPRRFFLTVHHEPENEVSARRGMAATDYAAMFRHVVTRLRAAGASNVVTVMTYTGTPNWSAKPWFEKLHPGDDVVDWIGLDPYADARVHDFAGLVDQTRPHHPTWPGFYQWAKSRFPAKPLMVAEWGAFERRSQPRFKPEFFRATARQIGDYPQIKAMVYFDSRSAPRGDTRFDTTPAAAHAFTDLSTSPHFTSTPVPKN